MEKILLVDDEIELAKMIKDYLKNEGFDVMTRYTLSEGKDAFNNHSFSAVILDINLPDGSGLDLCRYVRDKSDIPILMLSARSGDVDKIMGLGLGSDDYITKPFSIKILLARINAALRRNTDSTTKGIDKIDKGPISIDFERYIVTIEDKQVKLTATEFKLLELLIKNTGKVFTRTQIVEKVHGDDYPVTERSVDVQVVGLRKKIGNAGELIETIRGIGYKFKE